MTTEVVFSCSIRMQADTLLPEHQKRHYRGVADALWRVSKEEGVRGLYRGVGPNVGRAMALNMGMLASNDQVTLSSARASGEEDLAIALFIFLKNFTLHSSGHDVSLSPEMLRGISERYLCLLISFLILQQNLSPRHPRLLLASWIQIALSPNMCAFLQIKECLLEAGASSQASVLGAASIAGFVAAACSLPFDFVKTRMQEMARNPDGSFPYKGFADCAMQTARKEGLQSFYTGFPTYCIR